jgi:hypothetical protein
VPGRPAGVHRGVVAAVTVGVLLLVAGAVRTARHVVRPAAVDSVAQTATTPEPVVAVVELLPPPLVRACIPVDAAPLFVASELSERKPADEVLGPPERRRSIKHRHTLSDEDLRRQLVDMPEIRLDADARSFGRIQAAARSQTPQGTHPTLALLIARSDFRGLPMRMGAECQIGKESADNLQALSRKLRNYLQAAQPRRGNRTDPRLDAAALRECLLPTRPGEPCEWLDAAAVPTLVQLLQGESRPVRLLLVELLARIPDRSADEALAWRALFDLSVDVREAAIRALVGRPRDESRAVLLDGFRYPWPPVADHAAEALAALQDQGAVPRLLELLNEGDPRTPFFEHGRAQVRELVRVNHLSNCLLCHAPSASPNDPVRGLMPTPGQPLPAPTSAQYYQAGSPGLFVRADVTYLRQDFSVVQPVDKPGPWPHSQRYDYLVRTRPADVWDWSGSSSQPYRGAITFALAELDPEALTRATGNALARR